MAGALGRAGKQEVATRHRKRTPAPPSGLGAGDGGEQKPALARTEGAVFSEPRQVPVREAMGREAEWRAGAAHSASGRREQRFRVSGRVGPGAKGVDV